MAKLKDRTSKKRHKIVKDESFYISSNLIANKCNNEEFYLKKLSIIINYESRKIK